LFAGGGTTVRYPRQMPWAHAMELLLTADMVSADRAMGMGLLNAVVARDDLLPAAYEFAHRIAANAPLAVAATKQAALEGLELDMEAAYANETRLSDMVFASEDAKEGPLAFREKRPPVWKGR
jgi:enoyl-CoA hydratase